MDIQSNQYLRQVIDSSVEEFDVVLAKMQFILTVLEDVVSLLGLLGNLLIILFFIKSNRKNLKKMTPYLFLLIQLAIVDSLICIEIILTSHYLGNLFGIQYISINIGLLKLYTWIQTYSWSWYHFWDIRTLYTLWRENGRNNTFAAFLWQPFFSPVSFLTSPRYPQVILCPLHTG